MTRAADSGGAAWKPFCGDGTVWRSIKWDKCYGNEDGYHEYRDGSEICYWCELPLGSGRPDDELRGDLLP